MRRLSPWLVLCLFCTPLFAQTTGNLTGKITDSSGASLPGVSVEVKSPAMQGTRTALAERDGTYRFAILPPGEYVVSFRLEGMAPEVRRGVVISLGKETSLDVTMKPAAVSAEIVVSAAAPVLDTTSTTLGTNLNTRTIETLPSGRNYSALAQVTP